MIQKNNALNTPYLQEKVVIENLKQNSSLLDQKNKWLQDTIALYEEYLLEPTVSPIDLMGDNVNAYQQN